MDSIELDHLLALREVQPMTRPLRMAGMEAFSGPHRVTELVRYGRTVPNQRCIRAAICYLGHLHGNRVMVRSLVETVLDVENPGGGEDPEQGVTASSMQTRAASLLVRTFAEHTVATLPQDTWLVGTIRSVSTHGNSLFAESRC